jgi:integrase
MPRQGKGAHLWWRKPQYNKSGQLSHLGCWHIKDGRHRESTGCGADDREGAECKLEEYLARKRLKETYENKRAPSQIPVADVIALYSAQKAPKLARPQEIKARLDNLLDFFGTKHLSDVNGALCMAYEQRRGSRGIARRELEDLRAAINYHRRQGLCDAVVSVVLPAEGKSRERWITREEAAHLVRHAWRYREVQKGVPTGRASRRHIARFILAAIYTTRRKGAVLATALGAPSPGSAWVDLKHGVLYGRPLPDGHKKRQPDVPLPPEILDHMRRWHRNGQTWLVEWNGQRVGSIDKAFRATVKACGLGEDVVVHCLRHTGITWLAIEGKADAHEICRYAGITPEVFNDVYAHHHHRYMQGVRAGFSKHRDKKNRHHNRHHDDRTKDEQTPSDVTNFADFSRERG